MPRALELTGTVTELAPGGEGVLPVSLGGERRVVFVQGAAVGDELRVVVDPRDRPLRARSMRVVQASPDRRDPPCPDAGRCGGCPFMHLTPDAQDRARRGIVAGLVLSSRSGVSAEGVVVTHHPSPSRARYRTRARLVLDRGRLGYREGRSRDVVAVSSCIVLASPLDTALPLLRRALAKERALEIDLALGAGGKPVARLRGEDLGAPALGALDGLVRDGTFAGVSIVLSGASSPMRIGDPEVVTTAADGGPLLLAPGGFAQANPEVSRRLGEHVREAADVAGRHVVELFAGAGNLTTVLAPDAASYAAVELDADAVARLRSNLATRRLSVSAVAADADAWDLPKATEIVVLDPPRRGAPGASKRLAARPPRRVVYVSCDPATLARDARTLVAGGLRLVALATFDMFPETAHVETVATFVRA